MADAPDLPDHHCPGCGAPQRVFLRYPWYFCPDCRRHAVDSDGHVLEFANQGPMGGFCWRRAGEADWHTAIAVECQIKGRPALVHEARFGGIVAEPVASLGSLASAKITRL